ncbi:excinuclease ABC subunit B [Prochlorococcus marinus str. MIT 1342]|nr:excinuclease ABC subunit B [Prochlorococcus marinus str. MIT 1342]
MSSHLVSRALFERRDLIALASISYMYGLGIPSKYLNAPVKF